jgi:hypothetical protein
MHAVLRSRERCHDRRRGGESKMPEGWGSLTGPHPQRETPSTRMNPARVRKRGQK